MELNSKGMYRFTDPLKGFKVRVTLRKVTSNILLQPSRKNEELDILQMKPLTAGSDVEEYVFSWQEKVFSQDEFEWYSQRREYNTFLEKKYHEDVVEKARSDDCLSRRLYSYTEADISGLEGEQSPEYLQKSSQSHLEDEQSTLRLRRNLNISHRRWSAGTGFTKPGVVDRKMAPRDALAVSFQRMYIMADLQSQLRASGSDVAPGSSEEVILCKIEVDNNCMLRLTPDFTREMPYCIQNSRDEKFEFTIEHVSKKLAKKVAEEEKDLKNELYRKYMDIIRSDVGIDFQMPPIEVLKFFIFGEIVSAFSFDFSNLCIFYCIDLPKDWSTNDSAWLTGVTQRCKSSEDANQANQEDVSYFSFPFEGELTLALGDVDKEDVSLTPPTLLMEVLSYDNWGCVRTEGYGHMPLPLLPGSYNKEIPTWRPVGTSLKSKMQHYFTGGLTDLEDMTYVAVPNTFEGKQLSRLGFNTETSGTISIRIHIMQQSRYFIKSGSKKSDLLDKLTSKSQDSIALVLSAFQRARQRMLAARHKLLTTK